MAGALVSFEGIDQAGKQTQAQATRERLAALGIPCALRTYPDDTTPIGKLIRDALAGRVAMAARARTLLFAANRWERDQEMRALLDQKTVVLVDRYSWSNVVYGAALGFDEAWLRGLEAGLVPARLTFFIDILPAESRRRKSEGRDGFERDVALLSSAREHYLRLAQEQDWVRLDGMQPPAQLTADILDALAGRLAADVPPLRALRGGQHLTARDPREP